MRNINNSQKICFVSILIVSLCHHPPLSKFREAPWRGISAGHHSFSLESKEDGIFASRMELLNVNLTPSQRDLALRSPTVGAGACLSTGLLFKYIYIPR